MLKSYGPLAPQFAPAKPASCDSGAFLMCRDSVPDVPMRLFPMCRQSVPDMPTKRRSQCAEKAVPDPSKGVFLMCRKGPFPICRQAFPMCRSMRGYEADSMG